MSKLSYYQNITPSNPLKQKAKELSKEGLSLRAIAKELGVGKTTVERWIKEEVSSKNPELTRELPKDSAENPRNSTMKPDSKTDNRTVSQPSRDTENESHNASERVAMRKLELEHERELKRMDFELKQHNARIHQEKEERSNKSLKGLVRPIQQWAEEELLKAEDCPSGVPCLVSDIHEMHHLLGKFHKKLSGFQEKTNNWRALDYIESLTFLRLTTGEWSHSIKNTYKEELSGQYELTYIWNNLDIKYVEQLAENT
jgi:predicted transcriptional regulator